MIWSINPTLDLELDLWQNMDGLSRNSNEFTYGLGSHAHCKTSSYNRWVGADEKEPPAAKSTVTAIPLLGV